MVPQLIITLLWSCLPVVSALSYTRIGEGLTEIPGDIPVTVTEIILDNNPLSTIPSRAFSNFYNLDRLELNYCDLTSIAVDAFIGAPITTLFLRDNSLTGLEFLYGINATLELLSLSINPPALFSQPGQWIDVFRSLQQLRNMFMKKLELVDCVYLGGAEQLFESLSLSRNNISEFNGSCLSGMNSLNKLQLDENSLKYFPDLSHLPTNNFLRYLALQHNQIETVSSTQISKVPRLRELNLAYNKLTAFPDVRASLIGTLDLSGNPLVCDGNIAWLKNISSVSPLSVSLNDAPCHQPDSLVGVTWSSISIADLEPTTSQNRATDGSLGVSESTTSITDLEPTTGGVDDPLQDGDNATCISVNTTTGIFYKKLAVPITDPQPLSLAVDLIGSLNCSTDDLRLFMNSEEKHLEKSCQTQMMKRCEVLRSGENFCQFECDCPAEAGGCQDMLKLRSSDSDPQEKICEVNFVGT